MLNREFAYSLRVRLLEAVDGQRHHLYSTTSISASTNAAGTSHTPAGGVHDGKAGAGGSTVRDNTGSNTAGRTHNHCPLRALSNVLSYERHNNKLHVFS